MKNSINKIFILLLCFALIFSCSPAYAADGQISTRVTINVISGPTITGITEDFAIKVGEEQMLSVAAEGTGPFTFLWEVSIDGGLSFTLPTNANTSSSYNITNAQINPNGEQQPYIYRVTVGDASGPQTASKEIKVLVSNAYENNKISLRNGEVDATAYMHESTRLVVTPISESNSAAIAMEAALTPGCLPILICDASLVNQNDQVVPYFGSITLEFHVGDKYNGQTLKAFHLHNNTLNSYTAVVSGGILCITVNALSPFMIEAAAATNDLRTVTATSGAGGSISPSGKINTPNGTNRTFTFLPDAGYTVDRVTVDGSTVSFTGNSYTLNNITAANTSIFVRFRAVASSPTLHTISILSGANGHVDPPDAISVRHGMAQTFYFYPDSGYELNTLTVNGESVNVIGNSFTLSAVERDVTLSATFRAATTQRPTVYNTISPSAGDGGRIFPKTDTNIDYGGDIYFYFAPNAGYELNSVLIDGSAVSISNNMYHFVNVIADHTISASFRESSSPPPPATYYTISVSSGRNGSISPREQTSVPEGGSQTFYFIPDSGYEVAAVWIDNVKQKSVARQYTFENVSDNHSIRVAYKRAGSPGMGDSGSVLIWLLLISACAIATVICIIYLKKRRDSNGLE